MKTLLIQQVYPKYAYRPLLVECFDRNSKYCEDHDIDYWALFSEIYSPLGGAWDKIVHVQNGLKNYELVIWLDVDAVIFDLTRDMKTVPIGADSVGAVRFYLPSPHFNVGVLYFRSGDRTNKFLSDWLACYPGKGLWKEQQAFNTIAKEVQPLPVEWNRNYDRNPNANPVIMGFHGFGTPDERLALMRQELTRNANAAHRAEVNSVLKQSLTKHI